VEVEVEVEGEEEEEEVEKKKRAKARWPMNEEERKNFALPIISPAPPTAPSPSSFRATSVAFAQYSASYSSKSAVEGSPDDIAERRWKVKEGDAAVSKKSFDGGKEKKKLSVFLSFSLAFRSRLGLR